MALATEYERSKLRLAAQAWHQREHSLSSERIQPRSLQHSDASLDRLMGARTTTTNGTAYTRSSTSAIRDGQHGQQYRVGNLGNNGLLYLRPVNRPPQSNPPRVPSNEYREGIGSAYTTAVQDDQSFTSDDTGPHRSSQRGSALIAEDGPVPTTPPLRPSHSRSATVSKLQDQRPTSSSQNVPYKVIVEQASPRRKENTYNETSDDMLEVPIPHYRLGKPEFSGRGSATIRSSINTNVSTMDGRPASAVFTKDNEKLYQGLGRTTSREGSSQGATGSRFLGTSAGERRTISPELLPLDVSYNLEGRQASFRNSSRLKKDDSSVVRFSRTTGQILAATPSGLIAQITSPNMLDYELLSDFFLTFRSYLNPSELVGFLFTRLRWAVNSKDDFGRIVRVRTFVALRHWILNYFVDDFVRNYKLRSLFCDSVNELFHELKTRYDGGGGDLNIINELKKCWRRTCALYWDVTEHKKDDSVGDIMPGGPIGSRDSAVDQAETEGDKYGRSLQDLTVLNQTTPLMGPSSFPFPTAHKLDIGYGPVEPPSFNVRPATSVRMSHQSAEAQSCSIPKSILQKSKSKAPPSSYAPKLVRDQSNDGSAETDTRPNHHRRSGSFSDSRRDDRAPISSPKPFNQDTAIAHAYSFPGSVVRGAVYQPTNPYVHTVSPSTPVEEKPRFNLQATDNRAEFSSDDSQGVANPSVKRIIGGVRRALSARQTTPQTSNRQLGEKYKKNASADATARSSVLSINQSGGVPKRKLVGGRAQLRLDLLAAAAGESYKRVVNEDAEAEKAKSTSHEGPVRHPSQRTSRSVPPPQPDRLRVENPRHISHVTSGSRSIVIVDDTGDHPPIPVSGLSAAGSVVSRGYTSSNGGDPNTQKVPIALDLSQQHLGDEAYISREQEEEKASSEDYRYASDISASNFPQPSDNGLSKSPGIPTTNSQDSLQVQPTTAAHQISRDGEITHTGDSPTSTNDQFYPDRLPPPTLRRRPGGDLRAVDHVHDLEDASSQAGSTASSIPQRSLSTSVVERSIPSDVPPEQATLDPGAPRFGRKSLSMLATHSSQPNFRPSFEKEVAKLAQIPDDFDDGGIESALSKLEGRYEPSPTETRFKHVPQNEDDNIESDEDIIEGDEHTVENDEDVIENDEDIIGNYEDARVEEVEDEKSDDDVATADRTISSAEFEELRSETVSTDNVSNPAQSTVEGETVVSSTAPTSTTTLSPVREPVPSRQPKTTSIAESEASYSSVPLLERGVSHVAQPKKVSRSDWASIALPKSPNDELNASMQDDSTLSALIGHRVGSTDGEEQQRLPSAGNAVASMSTRAKESFLLDDNQTLSGLSEKGWDAEEHNGRGGRQMTSFYNEDTTSLTDQLVELYGDFDGDQTPRADERPPTRRGPQSAESSALRESQRYPFRRGEVPNFSKPQVPSLSAHPTPGKSKSAGELRDLQSQNLLSYTPGAAHLPFILGYSSLAIAQQLTLIEKDALSEIDWRELIDLRWRHTASSIRDWADFLTANQRTGRPICSGVDVCIARFNIVVKWAVSEIVLTQEPAERVACIVKYIHIAQHCRRLRNWATMYQLTTALVCSDSARLKATWRRVPAHERDALQTLEDLIMPMRNFHNLRAEMETATANRASAGADGACIPFIGIYTHDLIYNAQKPAFAAGQAERRPQGGEGAEPLVNFERYHTAASIVKNLLRMLEAAAKYNFPPNPELLARCLWVAALPEEELARKSQDVEP